jgi:hypothetical protein
MYARFRYESAMAFFSVTIQKIVQRLAKFAAPLRSAIPSAPKRNRHICPFWNLATVNYRATLGITGDPIVRTSTLSHPMMGAPQNK